MTETDEAAATKRRRLENVFGNFSLSCQRQLKLNALNRFAVSDPRVAFKTIDCSSVDLSKGPTARVSFLIW